MLKAAVSVGATRRITGESGFSAHFGNIYSTSVKIDFTRCDFPVPALPVRNIWKGDGKYPQALFLAQSRT